MGKKEYPILPSFQEVAQTLNIIIRQWCLVLTENNRQIKLRKNYQKATGITNICPSEVTNILRANKSKWNVAKQNQTRKHSHMMSDFTK